MKMRKQRLFGVLFIIIFVIVLLFAATGETAEERDATAVLLFLPLGIYMMTTRNYMLLILPPDLAAKAAADKAAAEVMAVETTLEEMELRTLVAAVGQRTLPPELAVTAAAASS
jgi:hypothetical protein